jgi:CDP-diglyceride synthetase
VEHGPDEGDDETTQGAPPRPARTGSSTGGVRIIGAETAAEITSEIPVVPPAHVAPDATPHSSVRILDEPSVGDEDEVPTPAPTELPHWTEPPTGQVPAVLARDEGESTSILPPTWREEDADWVAHEEEFEPSMFSGEQASLGALDETGGADEELRPWEFDLSSVRPGQPGPGSTSSDPVTEPVEVVRSGGDAPDVPAGRTDAPIIPDDETGEATSVFLLADVVAAGARPDEPEVDPDPTGVTPVVSADPDIVGASASVVEVDPARPSGTPRVGRARRAGLRPDRLKAKRPDDDVAPVGEPLAAEPPGASVVDVPGAGRRKAGLAGLAAADRAAVEELAQDQANEPAPAETVAEDERAGSRLRRRARREPTPDRPPRSSSNYAPEVTGGGPPEPVPERTRHADETGGSSTGVRVGTGLAVAVVALAAFKVGTVTSVILCLLVVTFAAGEAFAVLRRAAWRPATLLGLVGTIALTLGAYNKGVAALPLVMVLITVFTLLWYLFGVERGSAVAGTASTLLVVGWVGLLGSFAGLLLCPSLFPDRHGIAFLLGAIIATVANDVGALVVGRWVGSHQLAPNVSPNKTWEGLAGGAVASVLVSTVAVGAIHPWTAANAAVLGLVVAVVAPLGDLCESLLKRDLRLKDMGRLLPGHGGVLDRVDALIFVLPATYYLVRALNIG